MAELPFKLRDLRLATVESRGVRMESTDENDEDEFEPRRWWPVRAGGEPVMPELWRL